MVLSFASSKRPDRASATRLLLVEDDPAYAYLLRRLILEGGDGAFAIEEVDRLSAALEHLTHGDFDEVLLDLYLPDSSGLATFQEVHRLASDVPIVVLSGLDDERVAVQAVREGAQDYLVKGAVDGAVLLRSIRYAIERHETQKHWRELSLEDDLTDLYNRRGFLALGDQQLKLARRNMSPLLVVFFDLDGLKEINDSLGHEAGNQALLEAAELLKGCFRETDVVSRLGGDEFVVLLDGVDRDSFRSLGRRLEAEIAAVNQLPGRSFQLSLSWGTAEFDPRDPRPLEELIWQADKAMYGAKRRKRA